MTDHEKAETYLSPPIQRAARLLRQIAEGDDVKNMSTTAKRLEINRTTLFRLLHTLERERFIERHDGGWRIGLGLIGLAARTLFSGDLVQTAVPILEQLAETLGLSAHLGVLDEREVVYVVRRTPNHTFASNIKVGSRLPAHAANMGRILLAYLPAERVDALYAHAPSLPAVTSQTPTTLKQLKVDLEALRAERLAWSDGSFEPGISSVAAPVFDATGAAVAAVNVSGQIKDFKGADRRKQIAQAISTASDEISERLGWFRPQKTSTKKPLKVAG